MIRDIRLNQQPGFISQSIMSDCFLAYIRSCFNGLSGCCAG